MTVQNFLRPKREDRHRRDPMKENTDDLWQKDLKKRKKNTYTKGPKKVKLKHGKDLKQSKK